MVLNNIEDLLRKYDNGETSLKEERELRNYFSNPSNSSEFEFYKPLFAYFSQAKSESYVKPASDKNKFFKWGAIAVVAILLVGAYNNLTIKPTVNSDLGNLNDPKLAYQTFSEVMQMLSSNYNKGALNIEYLNEIEHSAGIIFKTTKNNSNEY